MELRQLRYFVAVADELHFRRAAERLGISQPALSFDIRKFEEQLGTSLFDRDKKIVTLTHAGRLLLRHAESLLRQAADAEALVKRSAMGLTGILRVGFVNAMLYRGLLEATRGFERDHPGVEIVLSESGTSELTELIAHRKLDVAFSHRSNVTADVVSETIFEETFVGYLPKDHRLASRKSLALSDLQQDDFICFPRAVSPAFHDSIVAQCVNAGFSPRIRHEARLWHTILMMVQAGMGVAIVPETLQAVKSATAVFRPLAKPSPLSEIVAIRPAARSDLPIEDYVGRVRAHMTAKARGNVESPQTTMPPPQPSW